MEDHLDDHIDPTVSSTSAPSYISLQSLSSAQGTAAAVDSPTEGPTSPHAAQPPAPQHSTTGSQTGLQGVPAGAGGGGVGAEGLLPKKALPDAAEGLSNLQGYIRRCGGELSEGWTARPCHRGKNPGWNFVCPEGFRPVQKGTRTWYGSRTSVARAMGLKALGERPRKKRKAPEPHVQAMEPQLPGPGESLAACKAQLRAAVSALDACKVDLIAAKISLHGSESQLQGCKQELELCRGEKAALQAALEEEQSKRTEPGVDFETKMCGSAGQLASSQRERCALQAALEDEKRKGKAAAEQQERALRACQSELQACERSLAAAYVEKTAAEAATEGIKQESEATAGELHACRLKLEAVQQERSALQALLQDERHKSQAAAEEHAGKLCACRALLRGCMEELDSMRTDKRALETALVAELQLGGGSCEAAGAQQDARVAKLQAACCALGTELEAHVAANSTLCAMLRDSSRLNARLQAQTRMGLQGLLQAAAAAGAKGADVAAHAAGSRSLHEKLAVMAFALRLLFGAGMRRP